MPLSPRLAPQQIIDLEARDREDALRTLARGVAAEEPAVGLDALVAALLARERLASTGFGGGLAMPHVRLAGIRGHHAVLGRVRAGLPFDALDGAPVHLLLLIVGPDGEKERYQRLMAHAARFLKSEGQALIDADDLQRATSQALASY